MECILTATESNLKLASNALASGKLVAFPTETVYGLGGNALIESVVRKIYEVKGRPATDPLICHVDCLEKAVRLWDFSCMQDAAELASVIGSSLWPGPLTIVCKADSSLPSCVTGGSNFVGARIPRHPVALKLLSLLPFPLAGPSANMFGHVSPTTAKHVYDDLFSSYPELLILDGGDCEVGIESTVIKINSVAHMEVVRRGGVSINSILAAISGRFPNTRVDIRDTRSKLSRRNEPMDGPGQLLTHYSPSITSALITPSSLSFTSLHSPLVVRIGTLVLGMGKVIVMDYKAILSTLKDKCFAYRDLSPGGSAKEASFEVFDTLRWTEHNTGASAVIFPLLSEWVEALGDDDDLLAAVEDRLFRAASGAIALERIQRINEGDEVDTSTEQKVKIDLQRISDTESTALLTFSHEDHTLGNPLRHVLMQNPDVSTAGYSIPHPLETKMLLHVQSSDYAVDVVRAGLEQLAKICEETLASFDACLLKQEENAES